VKFWLILIGIFLTLAGVVFIYLLNINSGSVLSQKSKNRALIELLGRNPHLSTDKTPTTWNLHKSKYIEVSYPSWAKIYERDDQKAIQNGNLDNFSFYLPDIHITGVISVVNFNSVLSEFPGVNLRLSQKDIYTLVKNSTEEADFTKDADTYQRTSFLKGNGEVVSIAITGYSKENVENIFNKLLSSLKIY